VQKVLASLLKEDLVLLSGGHMIEGDATVIGEGSEAPGVACRPRDGVDRVLVSVEAANLDIRDILVVRIPSAENGTATTVSNCIDLGQLLHLEPTHLLTVVVIELEKRRGGDGRHAPQVDEAVSTRTEHELVVEAVILDLPHPVRMLRKDLEWLRRFSHVPELDFAVVTASDEVIRFVWIVV
jgi:hypothetical protein